MRTSLLIFLGFAVLAVTLAAKPRGTRLDKKQDVDKRASESIESNANDDTDEPSTFKSRKGSESDPKKKRSKASVKGEVTSDLEEDEEVEIPSLDQLTTNTDPIKLGQRIKRIKDDQTRKRLERNLKKMLEANKGSLPGKFYQAAYTSLRNEKKASKFWDNNLENIKKMVEKYDKTNFGDSRNRLGASFETFNDIVAADPVGMGLEKSESILLTALSDTLKNTSKVTDLGYDAAINASRIFSAITSPVDALPIAGAIKRNFHDNLEGGLRRGKYLAGSFADDGSRAFENAAIHANQRSEAKQDLLNRSLSKRTI